MKTLTKAALAATILAAGAPTMAVADSNLYAGASLGSASLSEDFDGFDVDSSSIALRIVAGWQLNDYFSLEGGYQNFGEFEQTFDNGGQPVDVSLKADGFTLGVTGTLPLSEQFALFGRAGSFFWDGDAEINDVSQARPADTNLYLGVGAKYVLSDRVAVLGDWTRYTLEDTESGVFALGVVVGF